MKKLVITGGGTGGHVFPALAIADELKERGFQILYVGTNQGMEAKLVPERGFPLFTVRTGSVKNQKLFKILKTLLQLFSATGWAIRFLLTQRPVAVLGVGGYVSVPTCLAAYLVGIPVYLQEQNASVGIANRFLGRLSKKIFLGFDQAKNYFNPAKCIVTGNPIRGELSRPDFPPYQPDACSLLVMGGSQGAQAINDAILSLLEELQVRFPGLSVTHQTGQKDFEKVKASYEKLFRGNFTVAPFFSEIASLYAKASLVVSRSGALTVSELIQVGRPAILVPYPRKGQNDQTSNAYYLESHGAAKVVEQGPDFQNRLKKVLLETFQKDMLKTMEAGYIHLRLSGAQRAIGDTMVKDLGGAG